MGGILDRNFSKESMFSVAIMVGIATIFNDIVLYILKIAINAAELEIVPFLKVLTLETLYNVVIFAIIYPVLMKLGEKLKQAFTKEKGFMKYY